MDKLLLFGETSNGGGRRDRLYLRSEAITYGSPYQRAAALVDLAEDGVGLPEQVLDKSNFGSAAKFYFIFIKFHIIWTLNYFALVVLNFFEKPLWCWTNGTYSCSDRGYFFLGQLPYFTATESIMYEVVTLILLAIHTFFPITYEGSSIFWKRPLNQLKVVCFLLLVADLLVFFLYLSPVAMNSLPFRVAPYVRVILFILSIRELRTSIIILAGMSGTYLNVLALWLLFLLFASWVAYVMFEDTQQGLIFHMQNAGFLNKEQCIHLFEELHKYRSLPKISREEFELIFDELDDSRDFKSVYANFNVALKEMCKWFVWRANKDLDKINLDEFTDLCSAIGLRFQKEETPPFFERFQFYRSPFSENLKAFVRGPKFGYMIILNLFAVIIETTLDIENNSGQKVWQEVEFVFGWIYVLEMALKVYSFGFANYWREGQNQFDFLITWIIVIGETITFATPHGLSSFSNGEWIRYLLLARMLRLIRLLMHVQSYRAFVATFLTLLPSLMPYLGTIFCVLCIYCTIGVQFFGGLVNAGNQSLAATELTDNEGMLGYLSVAIACFKLNYFAVTSLDKISYLLFNFNDYPNGMVTLFNLLVMGNWQVWMQSYKEFTGTSWTFVYFISFYLITVLLLLNLVVAFVLEAFFTEMNLETSGTGEEADDQKCAGSGKGRRRLAGTKRRSQRVDILLHRMLSAELDKNHPSPSSNA
ncbi:hypothetical protein V6N11_067352 [Hibiscus sabdariffa]|uniref:Ion transport domain-containing protein n=1 Tax=Hibiscus sabdariffa TaxID=183260 RepID=A0ABR2SRB5_9ROSI